MQCFVCTSILRLCYPCRQFKYFFWKRKMHKRQEPCLFEACDYLFTQAMWELEGKHSIAAVVSEDGKCLKKYPSKSKPVAWHLCNNCLNLSSQVLYNKQSYLAVSNLWIYMYMYISETSYQLPPEFKCQVKTDHYCKLLFREKTSQSTCLYWSSNVSFLFKFEQNSQKLIKMNFTDSKNNSFLFECFNQFATAKEW